MGRHGHNRNEGTAVPAASIKTAVNLPKMTSPQLVADLEMTESLAHCALVAIVNAIKASGPKGPLSSPRSLNP
jgi:hypothetical protein